MVRFGTVTARPSVTGHGPVTRSSDVRSMSDTGPVSDTAEWGRREAWNRVSETCWGEAADSRASPAAGDLRLLDRPWIHQSARVHPYTAGDLTGSIPAIFFSP